MKYPIYLLLITCICFGCTKELPFPDVENNDLIVMNALINPEQGVNVHLSQSCHITDNDCEQKTLENAQIILKDEAGSTLVELTHTGNGNYTAEGFQVEHNKEYTIEASSAGLETITSKTKTPKPFVCTVIEKDEKNYQGHLCRTFKIEIEDNPDETNYYLIDGWVDILDGSHDYSIEIEYGSYILPHTGFLTRDVNAENNGMVAEIDVVPYPLDYIFLTDENFNGETYVLEFGLYDEDLRWQEDSEFDAHIKVKSVSKELYDYYKSVTSFKLKDGNPFGEPPIVFSNIEKGVGIFGGFTQNEFIETLPETGFWFPREDFAVENNGCTGPCTVKFSVDMGDQLTPIWDFGDGNTSSEKNPEHEYQNPGEYQVTLEISIGGDTWGNSQGIQIN